jgi:RNA polymerase sigma factor (sigma-70 family)
MTKQVLVVDDEVAMVEGLTALFDCEQIESEGADSRIAAEALLDQTFFQVVLTDLCLHTREEGLQLVDHIRRTSPRSRIVVLSAYATWEIEDELLTRGVSLVLQKPTFGDAIIEAVQALLAEIEREADEDDSLTLEELYLSARKRLYSIPRKRFNLSHDRAEDVLQEAWVLFLQKRNLIQSAAPWLAGTVVNLSRQQLDRRTRKREVDEEASGLAELPDPRHQAPDNALAVRQALGRVDERTRMLCDLIGIEGLSYEEVSAATGLPLGSIGPLYIRAKKALRNALSH